MKKKIYQWKRTAGLKFFKGILSLFILMSLGLLSAKATCHAGFTYSVTAGIGVNGPYTVLFTNTSTGGGANTSYTWQFQEGYMSSVPSFTTTSQSPFSFTFTVSPSYYGNRQCFYFANLTMTDASTNCSSTISDSILVWTALPCNGNASFTYSVTSGSGTKGPFAVLFTNTSTGANAYTVYNWYLADGSTFSTSALTQFTYTFTATSLSFVPGVGYIYSNWLDMMDHVDSCSSYYSDTIIIKSVPSTCKTSYTHVLDSINADKVYFFSSSTGSPSNYRWDFGDGTTSTDKNPQHIYANSALYNVCLTAWSNDSTCWNTFCDTVNIIGNVTPPPNCYANFNWSQDNTQTNTIAFQNTSSPSATSYSWDFGDGTTSTLENPEHQYAEPGYYLMSLTIHNADYTCNTSNSTWVYVNGSYTSCKAWFILFPDSGSHSTYFGYNLTFAAPGSQYTWNWGDGTSSTGPYPSHIYQSPGSYQICVTVVSVGTSTCVSTYCDTVDLYKTAGTMRTVSITKPSTALGIQNNEAVDNSIAIAPNPFSAITNISYTLSEASQVSMIVRDIMGREIAVVENENNKPSGQYTTTWDGSSLAKGIYLLQLNVNGNISTKKMVVSGGQ